MKNDWLSDHIISLWINILYCCYYHIFISTWNMLLLVQLSTSLLREI
jgi:hypothetical protein